MHRVGHHHAVYGRLDRLRHQRLQSHALDRQAEPGHIRQHAGMPGHHDRQLAAVDIAQRGLDPGDLAARLAHARDLAFLDDVHPHVGTGPGIAPGHRVVARCAAARLPQRPQHRVARPRDRNDRHQFLDPLRGDELGRHALQRIGHRGALVAPHLGLGLGQHHHPAGAEHHVVIEVLAHRLVERTRLFIDRGGRILEVVRADDGGVAPGIAAAQPALLDHRHIGDAVVLAKIEGGGQPVAAGADDDHVVFLLRLARGPGPLPSLMVTHRLAGNGEG